MNNKTVLSVENLNKFFDNNFGIVDAVSDVSFSVAEQEIVGLIGESGSGKTTLGRCLIRLYDDYSGIIALKDKIISGKHINKKTNKFLRKNVQMIFQDPHSSLNQQKNVFAILKEPLIVNGLLKNNVNDLLKDLVKVQHQYRFDFQTKYYDTQIAILKNNLKLSAQGLGNWLEKLQELDFQQYQNIDDAFNAYYSFYEKNYNLEAESISFQYEKYEELYQFYFAKQQDYRHNNPHSYQTETHKIQLLIEKLKREHINEDQAWLIENAQNQLNDYLMLNKESLWTNINLFNAFYQQFKHQFKMSNEAALKSLDKKEWATHKLNAIVKKIIAKKFLIHFAFINYYLDNNHLLIYLTVDQIKAMANDLVQKGKDFIQNYDFNWKTNTDNFAKKFIASIYHNFNPSIKQYFQLAKKNHDLCYKKISDLKIALKKVETSKIVKSDEFYTKLNQLNQLYKKAEQIDQVNFSQMLDQYNVAKNKRYTELVELKKRWNSETLALQDQILKIFRSKHQEFLVWAKKKLLNENYSENQAEILIAEYQNKIDKKDKSYNNFQIEITILKKIFDELKFLYGSPTKTIHRFLLKWFFKNHTEIKKRKKLAKLIKTVDKWHHKIKKLIFSKHIVKKILLREKIYNALADVGLLRQFAYRYPHEFSGGQRQRIVIARALITEPSIIVADEPIASLDISIQAQIVNLLKELSQKKNIGIIFIAHDLSMVEYIADKILIMHLGKVVEYGKTNKIYSKPLHPYTINLFDSIPKMSNANEAFKTSKFDLNYLNQQKFPNIIGYQEVDSDHFLLGTAAQISEWTKK
ncbi:Oligopeptide ABC transporter, ATP-binding protein OppD [[Mycoplasma] cavipharyngis]|uniref:ATP-binding cassette domain-containing protein n=1 Tax=[Mycoplasma] cavipharyngis TaxID=92757 RepID=UPI0037049DE9